MRPALLRLLALSLSVSLGLGLAGCSAIQQMMPSHREQAAKARAVTDMQLKVMRLADEYAGGVKESVGRLQKGGLSADERLAVQSWKLEQSESAYTLASGPNAVANAIDMVVLATLSRMVLEDLWIAETHGERARPVYETHVHLERRAWELVADVLTTEQRARLKEIIDEWRKKNPRVTAVAYIHFNDFSKSVGNSRALEEKRADSIFSLLRIDPFTSLDPAVREITETRQLAERSIFYLQRAPGLLDMHVERISYAFAIAPETRAMLANVERVSLVGSAADRLVTTLPQMLATERQALIAQLMGELETRREAIAEVTAELRATLVAGTDTAKALHGTLESLDRVTARFTARPGASQATQPGRPFDIREYTQMVQELAVSTRELNALATRVDTALPAVGQATETAVLRLEQLTDYLVWRLAMLMAFAVVLIALMAFGYRAAVARISR